MTNTYYHYYLNKVAKSDKHSTEVRVGDYQTSYFFVCPSAKKLYENIESKIDSKDMDVAISSARLQDVLFYIEDMLVEKHGSATAEDVKMFEVLAGEIMDLGGMIGLRKEHNYIMDIHVKKVRDIQK